MLVDRLGSGPGRGGGIAVPWPRRRRRLLPAALALPLLLAACGGEEPATPSPASAAPTEAAAAATVAGAPGDAAAAVADGLIAATPDSGAGAGSPAAADGALTLGALADRMDAAWAGVRSFRAVVTTGGAGQPAGAASPAASPALGQPEVVIVREAILPDRQRQTIAVDGVVQLEAVAVGGRIYVRGTLAQAVRPDAGDAWVEIDPATLTPESALGPALGGIAAPIPLPGAAIPANLRQQELRPLGPVEVAGRPCQRFGAADTTAIGGRIDLTYAVDAEGRPCFVERAAGTASGRVTYEAYDLPLTIDAPATALPAASPSTLATPAGRD